MRIRLSCGKNETAYVESFVKLVTGVHGPPPTGTVYAFQTPVLFDEKRMRDSSAENDAPAMAVVSRNCSIVYCVAGRAGAVAGGEGPDGDDAATADASNQALSRIRAPPNAAS